MDKNSGIVQAYTFTDADKQHLVDMLAKSYLLAKTQAYQKALLRTKHIVQLHTPWSPQERDAKMAQGWAKEQVKGIVDTYESVLQQAIEQVLQQKHEAIGDTVNNIKQIVASMRDWFQNLLPWKSQQIANQTWGIGSNDGTDAWISDVLIADNIDGDINDIRMQVIPGESSSDFCKEYAGNIYSLYDDIPGFPAHVNCIHSKEIIVYDGSTEAEQSDKPTFLFIDIDGVLSIANAGFPTENIEGKEAWPIPIANGLLQLIESSVSFYPIWMTHWGKKANGWNERAGIDEWPSWYPLSDTMEETAHELYPHLDKKILSIQYCMYIHRIDTAIWVQDGFEPEDIEWAKQVSVELVDTTKEPLHSLLLSNQLQPEILYSFIHRNA